MNISFVKQAFPELYVPFCDSFFSDKIDLWQSVFEGTPFWDSVKRGGLYKKSNRRLNMLNTAKVLCDCFSDLTFSEQCDITIDSPDYQEFINRTLNENGFWKQVPDLLANAFALGGAVFKVYADCGKAKIDYIHADKFFPIEWNGKDITCGVFVTDIVKDGFYYSFFELHRFGDISYKLFKSESLGLLGIECDVHEIFPDINSCNELGVPMFSYFKPAVSNNFEYDSPLGISIFANALDTLKSIDIIFDSFSREFILGKKRIIVPASSVQTVVDIKSGEMVRYFDTDDEAFVALSADDNENLKIIDNTVELRVDEHISSLNALLNLLCFQVGLSAGSLSFDSYKGMKTAAEVISQDSKTARTIKSNKNLLCEAIEGLVHSLIAVGVWMGDIPKHDYNVSVGLHDSIIIDDNTLIDNNIKLINAGLLSKIDAVMEIKKCDESTAQAILSRISEGE